MKLEIENICKLTNKFQEFMNDFLVNELPIFLVGGGQGADWAIKLLTKNDIKIYGIIDKNNFNRNDELKVFNYDMIEEGWKNKDAYYLITSPKFADEIEKRLLSFVNPQRIYQFEFELYYSYFDDIEEYKSYIKSNEKEFTCLYEKLSDQLSKNTLIQVLKGRVSGDWKYFKSIYTERQYYPTDLWNFDTNDIYLDIGAFIGDSLEEVVKLSNNTYGKIYCFEPDKECFKILKDKSGRYKNVLLIDKGAWNCKETLGLQLDASHGASKVIGNIESEYSIELDCIDQCINLKDSITHIKMDIEGSELNALEGAKQTILLNKPFLAICVYHKNTDLLDISRFILSLVPEYKLFLRHHNISGTETVLYAKI